MFFKANILLLILVIVIVRLSTIYIVHQNTCGVHFKHLIYNFCETGYLVRKKTPPFQI